MGRSRRLTVNGTPLHGSPGLRSFHFLFCGCTKVHSEQKLGV